MNKDDETALRIGNDLLCMVDDELILEFAHLLRAEWETASEPVAILKCGTSGTTLNPDRKIQWLVDNHTIPFETKLSDCVVVPREQEPVLTYNGLLVNDSLLNDVEWIKECIDHLDEDGYSMMRLQLRNTLFGSDAVAYRRAMLSAAPSAAATQEHRLTTKQFASNGFTTPAPAAASCCSLENPHDRIQKDEGAHWYVGTFCTSLPAAAHYFHDRESCEREVEVSKMMPKAK